MTLHLRKLAWSFLISKVAWYFQIQNSHGISVKKTRMSFPISILAWVVPILILAWGFFISILAWQNSHGNSHFQTRMAIHRFKLAWHIPVSKLAWHTTDPYSHDSIQFHTRMAIHIFKLAGYSTDPYSHDSIQIILAWLMPIFKVAWKYTDSNSHCFYNFKTQMNTDSNSHGNLFPKLAWFHKNLEQFLNFAQALLVLAHYLCNILATQNNNKNTTHNQKTSVKGQHHSIEWFTSQPCDLGQQFDHA